MNLLVPKTLALLLLLFLSGSAANGQDDAQSAQGASNQYKPGLSRLLLRGYADATFVADKEGTTFGNARLVPLFIYRQSDKLLFEGELEFEVEDGEVEIALEYANIYYQLSRNATLRAGKILIPFGIFFDRLHPSWINRLPTVPLGYGHDAILPTSDLGIELRSGLYLGKMKANYSLYLVNGPRIEDGAEEADEVGMIVHDGGVDNNNNKAIGGRLGLFPLKDQSLELGFSAQRAKLGDRNSALEEVSAFLYAWDWTYVRNVGFLKGFIDLKGQINFINIEDQTYEIEEGGAIEELDFDNASRSSFFQLAYKPAMISIPFIQNIELVGRYSTMRTPEGAPWETDNTQLTVGLNYWIDWRTAFKFAYQKDGIDSEEKGKMDANVFYAQWTIGF